jgi:isopentenyldiphosphate isomerase
MALYQDIASYHPFNEQEAADRHVMLRALKTNRFCFDRKSQAHFTCSAWVVNPEKTQTIMVFHNIYNSWSWIGGHARIVSPWECVDRPSRRPNADKKAKASTNEISNEMVSANGISNETASANKIPNEVVNASAPSPTSPLFSLEVLTVDGHEKNNRYISSHLHLNVTYLVEVDPSEALRVKPDENSGVKWVSLDQVLNMSDEPWIRERIYAKLLAKLNLLKQLR